MMDETPAPELPQPVAITRSVSADKVNESFIDSKVLSVLKTFGHGMGCANSVPALKCLSSQSM